MDRYCRIRHKLNKLTYISTTSSLAVVENVAKPEVPQDWPGLLGPTEWHCRWIKSLCRPPSTCNYEH